MDKTIEININGTVYEISAIVAKAVLNGSFSTVRLYLKGTKQSMEFNGKDIAEEIKAQTELGG